MTESFRQTLVEKSPEKHSGSDYEEINSAKQFFQSLEIPLDRNGLVSSALTEMQVDSLAQYNENTTADLGIIMSTKQDFYRKVLLAVSLWRQRNDEDVNYLLGKGTGVEIALQGKVMNREKRDIAFPYRSHSDFELYGVQYEAGANGENLTGDSVYPQNFKKVFGGQEYFPVTATKGLRNLPSDLLIETAEVVDLGGVEVLVPQLELLFLDKFVAQESTPRQEGTDAELLAQQYKLDREKIHEYCDQFVIVPVIHEIKKRTQRLFDTQLSGIKRKLISLQGDSLVNTKEALEKLNQEMHTKISLSDPSISTSYSGIRTDLWIDLTTDQVDEMGNIVDQTVLQHIQERLKVQEEDALLAITKLHERIDVLFDGVEEKFV